jgi:hypothetical protein
MTNLSRRTLVTSATALPVLAVPALASFSPDHPDAELLRLAVQLEAVGREVEAETERAVKASEEQEAICERAGLPHIWPSDWPGGFAKTSGWFEYQEKRKALLAELLNGAHLSIVLNEHFEEEGAAVYRAACQLGCEGIVSKRLGSPYRSGRSKCWVKVKNPKSPAVKREAEEDWGSSHWIRSKTVRRGHDQSS